MALKRQVLVFQSRSPAFRRNLPRLTSPVRSLLQKVPNRHITNRHKKARI